MHREGNVECQQDVIQLRAKSAIKAAHSSALSERTAPSASEGLIISTGLIAHHLYLSPTRLYSDNNRTYLQVQKQYGAIHGCRCCQPYQLWSFVTKLANRCKQKGWEVLEMWPKLKSVVWVFSRVWTVKWISRWVTKCPDEKWKRKKKKVDSEALSELLSIDFLERLWTSFSLWLSDWRDWSQTDKRKDSEFFQGDETLTEQTEKTGI